MNDSVDREYLTIVLDRFQKTVPEVTHVVAVASDGLLLATTSSLDQEQAERVAAASSGFCGLAKQVNADVGGKGVRAVCIEMAVGSVLIVETSDGVKLATAVLADGDLDHVRHQLGLLSGKVSGNALTAAVCHG